MAAKAIVIIAGGMIHDIISTVDLDVQVVDADCVGDEAALVTVEDSLGDDVTGMPTTFESYEGNPERYRRAKAKLEEEVTG